MAYVLKGRAICPECGSDQFKWAPLVAHDTAILVCVHCANVTSLKEALQAREAQSLPRGGPPFAPDFAELEPNCSGQLTNL
jgi:hypothetical protein